MFRATVSAGSTSVSWGTYTTFQGNDSRSVCSMEYFCPSVRTEQYPVQLALLPAPFSKSRASKLVMEDLPEPEGPTKAILRDLPGCPGLILRFSPLGNRVMSP